MIFVAFESSLALPTASKEGRGQPTIFCAVLVNLCTDLLSAAEHPAYHTVTQHIKTLYRGTVGEHQQQTGCSSQTGSLRLYDPSYEKSTFIFYYWIKAQIILSVVQN